MRRVDFGLEGNEQRDGRAGAEPQHGGRSGGNGAFGPAVAAGLARELFGAERDEVAIVSEGPRPTAEAEDTISDEDLAVVENLDLLQDYDFLKDLAADNGNGGEVKTN